MPRSSRQLLGLAPSPVMEHTVSAGLGYRRGRYRVDLAYQYDVPAERRVGTSALQAGEYRNSRTEVGLHWLAITIAIES